MNRNLIYNFSDYDSVDSDISMSPLEEITKKLKKLKGQIQDMDEYCWY